MCAQLSNTSTVLSTSRAPAPKRADTRRAKLSVPSPNTSRLARSLRSATSFRLIPLPATCAELLYVEKGWAGEKTWSRVTVWQLDAKEQDEAEKACGCTGIC